MLRWNLKEDIISTLVVALLTLFIVWFVVTEPTFTAQSTQDKPLHISAKNLKKHVYTIVEEFSGRSYENIEVLNKTAEYIHKEFSKYSNDVAYQTYKLEEFVDEKEYEYKNVIANFKGRENCSDGVRIVGAHYDTFSGYAGANDNTSSVAGLLELARVLKENPPRCDVQLVAYTLEEPPAFRTNKMGSYIHAKRLKEQGTKVKIALVLETIGFYSDEENSQSYPAPYMEWYYPTKANFILL